MSPMLLAGALALGLGAAPALAAEAMPVSIAIAPAESCCSQSGILLDATGVESRASITGALRANASNVSISSRPASGRPAQ